MDMPLIGWAFRQNPTARENRELIIFVTPRLLTTLASN
jgi:type II secretory pathway component HofQ